MTIVPTTKERHLFAVPEKLGAGNFANLSAFPGYFRWSERNAIFRATGANIAHVVTTHFGQCWLLHDEAQTD